MKKHFEIINKIIEYEIYLYIIFMFLTKGEAIRNILIFSAFTLWLVTLPYRENKYILKEPVPLLFWGFIATILLSVIFSVDPVYSFKSLRGQPLKSLILLCLISTTLANEKSLKRLMYLFYFILVFTVLVSYYSFWAHDLYYMYPDTSLRHANPNRLAEDLNMLLSFSFMLLLIVKNRNLRFAVTITVITGVAALILSGSRTGLAAFLIIGGILLFYLATKGKINIKILVAGIISVIILSATVTHYSESWIKIKFKFFTQVIATFNGRTPIWIPLIHAVRERPVTGWGYGEKLFRIDRPFKNTPYKVAPIADHPSHRNPHNAFFRVLFHQGILGLIFYITLLIVAVSSFWRGAFKAEYYNNYVLIACTSVVAGTFIIHAIVESSHLTHLVLILGTGLAAKNMGGNLNWDHSP